MNHDPDALQHTHRPKSWVGKKKKKGVLRFCCAADNNWPSCLLPQKVDETRRFFVPKAGKLLFYKYSEKMDNNKGKTTQPCHRSDSQHSLIHHTVSMRTTVQVQGPDFGETILGGGRLLLVAFLYHIMYFWPPTPTRNSLTLVFLQQGQRGFRFTVNGLCRGTDGVLGDDIFHQRRLHLRRSGGSSEDELAGYSGEKADWRQLMHLVPRWPAMLMQ